MIASANIAFGDRWPAPLNHLHTEFSLSRFQEKRLLLWRSHGVFMSAMESNVTHPLSDVIKFLRFFVLVARMAVRWCKFMWSSSLQNRWPRPLYKKTTASEELRAYFLCNPGGANVRQTRGRADITSCSRIKSHYALTGNMVLLFWDELKLLEFFILQFLQKMNFTCDI